MAIAAAIHTKPFTLGFIHNNSCGLGHRFGCLSIPARSIAQTMPFWLYPTSTSYQAPGSPPSAGGVAGATSFSFPTSTSMLSAAD